MRAVQPRGPCFVGGWSAGGAIAYEIGQQLLAQGEDVALVVLFDTRTLAPSPAPAISEIPRPAGEASWGHLEVHDSPGNHRRCSRSRARSCRAERGSHASIRCRPTPRPVPASTHSTPARDPPRKSTAPPRAPDRSRRVPFAGRRTSPAGGARRAGRPRPRSEAGSGRPRAAPPTGRCCARGPSGASSPSGSAAPPAPSRRRSEWPRPSRPRRTG